MCRSPIFTSNVTVVSHCYFSIAVALFLSTNMTLRSSLKLPFFFFSHNQWLLEFGTNNLSTVLYLHKHLFHELLNRILSSVNFHWLSIFIIITAYKFIAIAACRVLLIFVGKRFMAIRLATTYFLSYGLQSCVYYKRHWHILMIIPKFYDILPFWGHFNCLATVYY